MSTATHIDIDTAALIHNLQRVRDYAPNCAVLAMVKADAYGHGLKNIATHLTSADALGVACLDEALLLRKSHMTQPIVLMTPWLDAKDFATTAAHNLEVVIYHPFQIALLQQIKLSKPLRVWLKIDTGMHRLGFNPEEAQAIWQQLSTCPNVHAPPRLMTHFACADECHHAETTHQIEIFNTATLSLKAERSLANSAAIIAWKNSHADWIRPGIMLYGVSPFLDHVGSDHGLKPVMTLRSTLIAIYQRRRGEKIGYGHTWTCPEDMRIGIVATGYGDGYPRHATAGTPVLLRDRHAPLIGRVCMDSLCIDLCNIPEACIGDAVTLWGKNLPIEIIARHANTIPYELLCHVKHRGVTQ